MKIKPEYKIGDRVKIYIAALTDTSMELVPKVGNVNAIRVHIDATHTEYSYRVGWEWRSSTEIERVPNE